MAAAVLTEANQCECLNLINNVNWNCEMWCKWKTINPQPWNANCFWLFKIRKCSFVYMDMNQYCTCGTDKESRSVTWNLEWKICIEEHEKKLKLISKTTNQNIDLWLFHNLPFECADCSLQRYVCLWSQNFPQCNHQSVNAWQVKSV